MQGRLPAVPLEINLVLTPNWYKSAFPNRDLLTPQQRRQKHRKEVNNLKNLRIRLEAERDPKEREILRKRIELAEHGVSLWGDQEGMMDKQADMMMVDYGVDPSTGKKRIPIQWDLDKMTELREPPSTTDGEPGTRIDIDDKLFMVVPDEDHGTITVRGKDDPELVLMTLEWMSSRHFPGSPDGSYMVHTPVRRVPGFKIPYNLVQVLADHFGSPIVGGTMATPGGRSWLKGIARHGDQIGNPLGVWNSHSFWEVGRSDIDSLKSVTKPISEDQVDKSLLGDKEFSRHRPVVMPRPVGERKPPAESSSS